MTLRLLLVIKNDLSVAGRPLFTADFVNVPSIMKVHPAAASFSPLAGIVIVIDRRRA